MPLPVFPFLPTSIDQDIPRMTALAFSPFSFAGLAAIDPIRTLSVIWESLGIFGYLFVFAILVILAFLIYGWALLGRNHSPIVFGKELDSETREDLHKLVHEGMDAESINATFFKEPKPPVNNIFFNYLLRFGSRRKGQDPVPSLINATDEQHEISRIQNASHTAKFLSMVLPAIGLLGTLIGMFNAFFGTDFTKGADLAVTMQKLMHDFALALFTTIIAVVLKIAADLFNHFTLEVYIAKMRGQLHRTRALLIDLYEEKPVAASTPVKRPLTLPPKPEATTDDPEEKGEA